MDGQQAGAALLRLLTWLSPAFPVGAFAYSGGLERAVHDRWVQDAAGLEGWIAAMLSHGSGWNDAVLFAEAWRQCGNAEGLGAAVELAEALAGSRERHQETLALGTAFLAAASQWACPIIDSRGSAVAYPVAVGAVAGINGIALDAALAGWLHAAASQLVSAGLRLGVAGQTDGVAILARLEPVLLGLAARAGESTLDDLGSAAIRADIAAMRHETQYSRLFRS
ncbi:urease accessory protein UreF [Rhizobiaceae bacterium BDR2-2]|uniref:Urease accessory protein UreF n=1 Tax=Ectorhizobium quercum TaxID=2965071 RepID=A0AAE3SVS1_9HYPH|nr:urease accessory protein UreF [Ectorhizobium quercum]MCX8996685.1 urease accessory protein UreF [Ectorhizobium quercum]